ncbi:hypothetical protein IWW36_006042, partial [Coemansia brasiliensis]
MMVWDASQADYGKVSEDTSFAEMARRLLDSGKKCTDGSDVATEDSTENSSSIESSTTQKAKHKPSSTDYNLSTKDAAATKSKDASSSHSNTSPTSESKSATSQAKKTADSTASVDVSEADGSDLPASNSNSGDDGHFVNEHLNRIAANTLEDTGESSSDTSDETNAESTEEATDADSNTAEDTSSTEESVEEAMTEDVNAESTDSDTSAVDETTEEATEDEDNTEETPAEEGEEETTSEDGNETTTVQSTRVIHETITKTRKIHMVTRHVTKRIQRPSDGDLSALTAPSPTTTNKTISIVTPTFPLPIARCPRADQPCMGAGFACNGYEFGQC